MSRDSKSAQRPWANWRLGTRWWVVSFACLSVYLVAMIVVLMRVNERGKQNFLDNLRDFPEAAVEVVAIHNEYFNLSHRILAALVALAATGLAFWLGRVGSRRMDRIRAAVEQLAGGDLETPVQLTEVPGFEGLAEALENVRYTLARRVDAEQRQQRLKQELEASHALRELFIPETGVRTSGGVDIVPHALVNTEGAVWLVREGTAGRLLLGVGSVKGERLGVTLLTGALVTAFHAVDVREASDLLPQAILTRLQIAFDRLSQGKYRLQLTVLCVEQTGWVSEASAGASNLWHWKSETGWRSLGAGELRAVQVGAGQAIVVGQPNDAKVKDALSAWCPQGSPQGASDDDGTEQTPLLYLGEAMPLSEAGE